MPTGPVPPEKLAEKIGYAFSQPERLRRAMTHASHAEGAEGSYERLEFLGDRVLGLIVADMLLRRFPAENEGNIARRLAAVVDRTSLAEIARSLDLGDCLLVGVGDEQTGTRQSAAVLADAMEALIGAVYSDGGLGAARRVVEALWAPLIGRDPMPPTDSKTALQEWAQGRGMALPDYRVTDRSGPDHAPVFSVEVRLGDRRGAGQGSSKRTAEQIAAAELLALIEAGE